MSESSNEKTMKEFKIPPDLLEKLKAGAHKLGSKLEDVTALFTHLTERQAKAHHHRQGQVSNEQSYLFQPRSYIGSRKREYLVYEPSGNVTHQARPLMVVLHGCQQDNRDIKQITGFNQIADKYGFLVAYPFITSYGGLRFENCWGWWFDREIHAGQGEVEDLWQIVEEIKLNYAVDPKRIHVAGLSSGAGMAVAMMVAHADKIASGASVAGMPYTDRADVVKHPFNKTSRNKPVEKIVAAMQKEMSASTHRVPIQIIHSRQDESVDIQSAENLRDSWGACFGIDTQKAEKHRSGQDGGTTWEHKLYGNNNGVSVIETLFLNGPGHGWYGGYPGQFSFPDGPDISEKIWKFCSAHPLGV
jgi:poly(hydroxyalkanoate) depolymerase family esterase